MMSLFLMLAAAAAASSAPTAVAQPTPVKADGDRIVCKSERFVGSHLSQRICKTKSDWETGKKNAQDALQKRRMITNPERGEGGDAMPPPPGVPR